MTVSDRLARFNRRVPNKVIGTIAGRRLSPVAYMLHQGRRSGRQYRTPVMPLPLGDGFLSRFLEKRGEGLHHVTFKTDDIDAAIEHLEGLGMELVDKHLDDPHWKEAFLRPTKSHGTLIQIAQSSVPDDVAKQRLRPGNLDELLA